MKLTIYHYQKNHKQRKLINCNKVSLRSPVYEFREPTTLTSFLVRISVDRTKCTVRIIEPFNQSFALKHAHCGSLKHRNSQPLKIDNFGNMHLNEKLLEIFCLEIGHIN